MLFQNISYWFAMERAQLLEIHSVVKQSIEINKSFIFIYSYLYLYFHIFQGNLSQGKLPLFHIFSFIRENNTLLLNNNN